MAQEYIRYTPYGELKEGDEYIRLGGRPVLLKHIDGKRDGGKFFPSDFGNGMEFTITRLERTIPSGHLREVAV